MKKIILVCAFLFAFAALATAAESNHFDFGPWPAGSSPQEIGKRVAEHFVATPRKERRPKSYFISYPEVCAWYGALTFAQLTNDSVLSEKLTDRFEVFLGAPNLEHVPPINHVDASVFGVVPLELYIQTHRYLYREVGLSIAQGQWDNPTADGLTNQTRYWIDDMFMVTALQVQAFRATGDSRYLDRAAREMVAYLDKLQQPNGLFYHAPDVPFFWGRGNGWVAVGMTELLRSMPENYPARPRILASYRRMMATLLEHQTTEGLWRQLVDKPDSWVETSASGMFTFAFVTGVKNGWLDAQIYGPHARRAWLGLITYINDHDEIREVCGGTNKKNDYQYYLDRPRNVGDLHGQAPLLWCASAFLR